MKSIYAMNKGELLTFVENDIKKNAKKNYSGDDILGYVDWMISSQTTYYWLSKDTLPAYLRLLRMEIADVAKYMPAPTTSFTDLGLYLASKYADLEHEEMHLICVDNANKIVDDVTISKGSVDKALVTPQMVFRRVLLDNSTGFFLCHNHPSGKLLPSPHDFEFTDSILKGSKLLKLKFLDHFIVGNGKYMSFRENDLMEVAK